MKRLFLTSILLASCMNQNSVSYLVSKMTMPDGNVGVHIHCSDSVIFCEELAGKYCKGAYVVLEGSSRDTETSTGTSIGNRAVSGNRSLSIQSPEIDIAVHCANNEYPNWDQDEYIPNRKEWWKKPPKVVAPAMTDGGKN